METLEKFFEKRNEEFQKIKLVIFSCKNKDQLKSAWLMTKIFAKNTEWVRERGNKWALWADGYLMGAIDTKLSSFEKILDEPEWRESGYLVSYKGYQEDKKDNVE